jgi:hypothetical protein
MVNDPWALPFDLKVGWERNVEIKKLVTLIAKHGSNDFA